MSKIQVSLRVRPLSTRELGGYQLDTNSSTDLKKKISVGHSDVIDRVPVVVSVQQNSVYLTDIRVPQNSVDSRQRFRKFDLDHVFWLDEDGEMGASQDEVYEQIGPSFEKSILEGYNASLLAYGQSGTGKTHTMIGTKENPGLIPRLCQSLYEKLKSSCKEFHLEISFMEIYREKIRDLLAPVTTTTQPSNEKRSTTGKHLKLREHPQLGPHVQGLTRIKVSEETSLVQLLWEGEQRRAIGRTASNSRSSRSHGIWSLYLTIKKNSSTTVTNQVHLVDLAGSEKAEFATAKNVLAEGSNINRSLVSLGNVISSLAEKAQYIPYRDSALSWFLKDSLGGNSTTAIIITASPASCCHAQTLNSLRFAQRARLVENQPTINFRMSNSNGNNFSTIPPVIATFEIKKDISRLANIIRTAQTNSGGIFQGLTPRWNRLINAIEGWNHQEKKEGTTTSTTTASTMTNSTLTDVMVQADLKYEDARTYLHSSSVPSTPSRVAGSEVFIPSSNSIKCLKWKKEEPRPHPPPKMIDEDSSDEESYLSPPNSPNVTHLKYLLKLNYPTTQNIDHHSRISEKIHRSFTFEKPDIIQLDPVTTISSAQNYPVVSHKIPTLVQEQYKPLLEVQEQRQENRKTVQVHCKGSQRYQNSLPSESLANSKHFCTLEPLKLNVLESTDEDEFEERLQEMRNSHFFRGIPKNLTKTRKGILTKNGEQPEEQETFYFSSESTTPSPSLSSSSYESLPVIKNVKTVEIVEPIQNDDKISDIIDDDDKINDMNLAVASITEESIETSAIDRNLSHPTKKQALNGLSSSKFRNYFARELIQMERIGNQIKKLQDMSEKYNILKPYLQQISELDKEAENVSENEDKNHNSCSGGDDDIEQCSGWNVQLEFEKVNSEISAINNLLKNEEHVKKSSPTESSSDGRNELSNGFSTTSGEPGSSFSSLRSPTESISLSCRSRSASLASSEPPLLPTPSTSSRRTPSSLTRHSASFHATTSTNNNDLTSSNSTLDHGTTSSSQFSSYHNSPTKQPYHHQYQFQPWSYQQQNNTPPPSQFQNHYQNNHFVPTPQFNNYAMPQHNAPSPLSHLINSSYNYGALPNYQLPSSFSFQPTQNMASSPLSYVQRRQSSSMAGSSLTNGCERTGGSLDLCSCQDSVSSIPSSAAYNYHHHNNGSFY